MSQHFCGAMIHKRSRTGKLLGVVGLLGFTRLLGLLGVIMNPPFLLKSRVWALHSILPLVLSNR
jgi:hypothetical protein